MSNDEPIEERLADAATIACNMMHFRLTPREQQVAWLYIVGTPAQEAITRLGMAYPTYHNHLKEIMKKLDPHRKSPRSAIIMMRLLLGLPGLVLSEPQRKAA